MTAERSLKPTDHGVHLVAAIIQADDVTMPKVESHLAAGHALPMAGAFFVTTLWNSQPEGFRRVAALMRRYLDAGYFGAQDSALVDVHSSYPLHGYNTPLLCLAILSGHAAPMEVLLERGALEAPDMARKMVTALRSSHGDMPEQYAGRSAEQMLETLIGRMFSSSLATVLERAHGALARRAAERMRDRIEAPDAGAAGMAVSAAPARPRARMPV